MGSRGLYHGGMGSPLGARCRQNSVDVHLLFLNVTVSQSIFLLYCLYVYHPAEGYNNKL